MKHILTFLQAVGVVLCLLFCLALWFTTFSFVWVWVDALARAIVAFTNELASTHFGGLL